MQFGIIHLFTTISAVSAASFGWDCTKSLGPCNNACYAMTRGLSPAKLTYDSDKSNRNARRTASGCNRTPCTKTDYKKWGNSCDEFPFASTKEGGSGAILRCVDSTENSSEGGQLSNFYKNLNDGDTFNIVMRHYGGAKFCENHGAKNDGSEFKLSNGAFKDAKRRRRDGELFVDADESPEPTGIRFREFEDENGNKGLLLNPHISEADVIGTEVWDNGNVTKIVKLL
ncbi:deoxyribonuclease NucA/NucB-domain-containing protein [Poronia punctata]|nr:deoxyribonuclease NucA/NucB-domain-containing protein [Poronia punctata]